MAKLTKEQLLDAVNQLRCCMDEHGGSGGGTSVIDFNGPIHLGGQVLYDSMTVSGTSRQNFWLLYKNQINYIFDFPIDVPDGFIIKYRLSASIYNTFGGSTTVGINGKPLISASTWSDNNYTFQVFSDLFVFDDFADEYAYAFTKTQLAYNMYAQNNASGSGYIKNVTIHAYLVPEEGSGKITMKDAEWGLANISSDVTAATPVGYTIPFNKGTANGITFDEEKHGFILKAGKTYMLEALMRAINAQNWRYYQFYDNTNKTVCGIPGCCETTGVYADAVTPATIIVTPKVDTLYTVKVITTGNATLQSTILMHSYFKCIELTSSGFSKNYSSNGSSEGTLKPWLYDSENEVVIGVYDGKPLYRKVIDIDIPVAKNLNWYDTGASYDGIEKVVNGSIIDEYAQHFPITIGYTTATNNIAFVLSTLITERTMKQLIIEYTKTTDAEGSGKDLVPYGPVAPTQINYSTEEQVIGKWLDGRDLYQKTYDITGISISANTWYDYIIDNTGIDFVTKIDGYRVSGNKKQTYPMNQYKTSDTSLQGCTFLYNADLPGIAIRPTSANTDTGTHWYVTIQYVKTTSAT